VRLVERSVYGEYPMGLMRSIRLFCPLACLPLAHAAVCDPAVLQGPYGFQLWGTTAIGAKPQPAAAVGRLVLDGSGNVNGVSSVKFAGLLLGNPVTGTYEAKSNCSVSWSLQDDSGNFQHFQGTMSPDGKRINFTQSDTGGARDGIMLQTNAACSAGDFRGRYSVSVSGDVVDVDSDQVSGRIDWSGFVEADGEGNVAYAADPSSRFEPAGSFQMDDDCTLQISLELASGEGESGAAVWNFRGVLVNGGKAVVGIESDPGTVATLRLLAK
jgi:hypothetical protein